MRNKIILLCLAFIFVSLNSYADTISLKSGKQIEGKILEMTNDAVKIDFEGVGLTYFFDQIDKINGKQIDLPKQEIHSKVSQEAEQPIEPRPLEGSESIKEVQKEALSVKADKDLAPTQAQGQSRLSPRPDVNTSKLGKVNATMAIGLMLFLFALGILFYIYFSLCLQFIAQKTNNGPVWLAWVPIGNLFLMCKIASLSYYWLLIVLLGFIPIIGPLANLAFSIFVWYRIALARNKPGWLAILLIIPLVNLIIMGYLAFSE